MIDFSKIDITTMQISDLDKIKENLEKDFDNFWNYQIFKQELVNNNSNYLCLYYDNELVCFGGFQKILDIADIMNIVTKKDKRNLGFAKLLLNELINIAKELNCTSITLEVASSNQNAIHLYEVFDFKQVGLRKGYYKSSGDDAILMTFNL